MRKVTLTWSNDSNIHKDQIVYRSENSFDSQTLPSFAVSVGKNARSYIDEAVGEVSQYYYSVATITLSDDILLGEVTAVPLQRSDPLWSNVSSLLHFDGPNGDTSIVDETGKSWTRTGDAQISTEQSKFGGSSAVFDGAGDRFNSPTSGDFTFGVGASTLEFWVRPTNVSGSYRAIVSDNRYPSSGGWRIYQNGADLQIWYQNTILQHSAVGVLSANVWVHIAWVRTTTASYLFVNGNLAASSTSNFLNLVGTAVSIGAAESFSFNGYVDEFRVTKGAARYTSSFTPPVLPFPNG